MATLQVLFAGGEQTYELTDDLYTVGRVPDNAIQIDDASVSSHHAQLTLVDGQYELEDLNSTNGTRVNGEPQTKITLFDGARIRFGQVNATFMSGETAAESLQPLPEAEDIEAEVAASTSRPVDFKNASPFGKHGTKPDRSGKMAVAVAALAILAGLTAIALVFMMQSPI